ncbi:MAG: low molecular weight protein-tyrosine-phosphatase [Candidatus Nanopelagicales bacterium]
MTTPPFSTPAYRITTVCLGNICRSPMAEAVLRDRIEQAGLTNRVAVDSAGTGDWHIGHDADERALSTLSDHDYSLKSHRARQIDSTWMNGLDLIVVMDSSNYTNVEYMINNSDHSPELIMFRAFDPELSHLPMPHPDLDVPDPYYGSGDGFTTVLQMIERASDGLIAQLPQRLRTADSKDQ